MLAKQRELEQISQEQAEKAREIAIKESEQADLDAKIKERQAQAVRLEKFVPQITSLSTSMASMVSLAKSITVMCLLLFVMLLSIVGLFLKQQEGEMLQAYISMVTQAFKQVLGK